jgi:glycosyltransferase involved in cell wall biosynthesis
MKILIIPDVPHWAIGKLSKSIKTYNPDLDIDIHYVHPRDAEEPETLAQLKKKLDEFNPDVVHFQYWNTAQKLIKLVPELRELKTILTHHNQKNLKSEDWNELGIDFNVCHTQKAKDLLIEHKANNVSVIQHGINLKYFTYNPELPTHEKYFGYVGRICPWKGMKEVAKAAREIGYPVLFMGKVDKVDYWNEIDGSDKANIHPHYMDCADSERIEAYHDMSVYVGNSGDGREEGTLGLLEAMASGVPVVTTPSGEAMDICENEVNALVVPFGDYDALKKAMNRLMNDEELANRLRKNAWNTVKNMCEEKMALQYRRLYKDAYYGDEPLVSVIIPYTEERMEQLIELQKAYGNQTYKNIELILVEDSEDGYNLAKVRNIGAIRADGEILLFNDSRMCPDPDAVEEFMKCFNQDDKSIVWYFGDKGAGKKNFVENFSAIRREYFIKAGMCCERIEQYGAMSQELRERFMWQGFRFQYVPEAKCKELCSTHKTADRRQDIIKSKLLMYKMGL